MSLRMREAGLSSRSQEHPAKHSQPSRPPFSSPVPSTTNLGESPMPYVDGFLLAVPKKNLKTYARIAALAGKIWKEHGALEYRECVGEDLDVKWGVPFPKYAKVKKGETVIFSWIVYKSRAHRDKVNAKVMKDQRLNEAMKNSKMPFDMKRMA